MHQKFNIKKVNWSKFSELCEKSIATYPEFNIEDDYKDFISKLLNTANVTIPKTSSKPHHKQVPYWTEKCKVAANHRNAALKLFKSKNDSHHKNLYLKAKAQRVIRQEKTNTWNDFCDTITDNTKLSSVSRMAKSFSGIKTQNKIPTLKTNTKIAETNFEKTNSLANHFSQISSNDNYPKSFLKRKERLQQKWKNAQPKYYHETEILNSEIQLYELENAIKNAKNNTSPGQDQIRYEIIKDLPTSSQIRLLKIFNKISSENTFIGDWNYSIVLPLLKNGENPSNPNSYRPIALTSCFCKIMEKIISNRLTWFLEENNLLNPAQAGFRKNRNSVDQILRLHDSAFKSINTKQFTIATFLDFSKAFDMLWVKGLLHKLRKLKIHGQWTSIPLDQKLSFKQNLPS